MLLRCVVVCSVVALAAATTVGECSDSSAPKGHHNVELIPCKSLPCRLKKGSNQHIKVTFTTAEDMDEVMNHVTAKVFGVPLPFVGVDGNSICSKLFTPAGDPVKCPIQSGTTYVYKDSFPVHTFYPSLNVEVRWALGNKKNEFMCFTVPAKIA